MFDQMIYERAVQQFTDVCVTTNATERIRWENEKAGWLELAPVAKAMGNPLPAAPNPPAKLLWVSAPAYTPGIEQSAIQINVGPDRVADPTCELPPPPAPNPPGIADVGPHNWGEVWGLGMRDTMPAGAIVLWQGHRLQRVGPSPFGRGFYREVS